MFSEHVRMAIVALAETDREATDADREELMRVLGARRHPDVIGFADASRRTGLHVHTIMRMVKAGKLVAVRGSGSRNVGVTASSVERMLLAGRPAKRRVA